MWNNSGKQVGVHWKLLHERRLEYAKHTRDNHRKKKMHVGRLPKEGGKHGKHGHQWPLVFEKQQTPGSTMTTSTVKSSRNFCFVLH